MLSLTEQEKKPLPHQNATKLKKMQSPYHFQQDNSKQITRRDSSLTSVYFYSQVTFFLPKFPPNNSELLPQLLPRLPPP